MPLRKSGAIHVGVLAVMVAGLASGCNEAGSGTHPQDSGPNNPDASDAVLSPDLIKLSDVADQAPPPADQAPPPADQAPPPADQAPANDQVVRDSASEPAATDSRVSSPDVLALADLGADIKADAKVADVQGQPDLKPDLQPDTQPDIQRDLGTDTTAVPDAQPETEAGGGVAAVQLVGRFDLGAPPAASFGWSGSAMVARFQGTGAQLSLDGSPNQFAVIVDGVVSSTLKTTGSTSSYTVASGLAAGTHDLVLWKRTEGNQGENRYLGLTITGGQLAALPARPDRRIEIYGDSISAGYGIEGADQYCGFSQATENNYLAYGSVAARALGADMHAIVWSGIGMYRNYGVSGASSDAMPAVYARTLPNVTGSAWDFSSWQPHAVIINLGTNDASTNGDPGTPFRNAYLAFVRNLRQRYPNTFFVLTIGPMLDGANLTAIKGHLQAVIQTRASEGDTRMSFLEFPVQTGADGYGCDWHPSVATDAKMANLLVNELKTRLGW
jgi:lysophospholipase L1-like esterase